MHDGIALMGDEFWPRLDDVKQFSKVLHTVIEAFTPLKKIWQISSVTKL
jgi:hypothetical protein